MVSIELVNVFKLLVVDSILVNFPFWVSLVELNDEDKLPILELSPLVVVATDELKEPTDELSPEVVVATDELNDPIESVKPLVVVATEELSAEIDPSTLELNVE